MRYRTLGRLDWQVSEIGYGMWGIAGGPGGFTGGADYDTAPGCLDLAVELGCNFFDTAWAYGRGISEQMLGALLRRAPRRASCTSRRRSRRRTWSGRRAPTTRLDDVFPPEHIREYVHKSLENLGADRIDLLQFHVWEDRWAEDERWQEALSDLKREGLIGAVGISVNRWEPANCLAAIDTGLVDAVQVIYNIFDQAPEDELFPRTRSDGIGVIARVPFDEGTLDRCGPRRQHLARGRLAQHLLRAGEPGPERRAPGAARRRRRRTACRYPSWRCGSSCANPAVSTVIPGMRTPGHVRANLAASEAGPPDGPLLGRLRQHRWDRVPAWWSG